MKKLLVILAILLTSTIHAAWYETESFEWDHGRDWATFDTELEVYYQFLPMTEKAHDAMRKLDRRFNYECQVKERNLRHFFRPGSVVIALYDVKDCKKTGRNPNWKN